MRFDDNAWTTLCVLVWFCWFALTLGCNLFPASRLALALRRRDRFGLIPGFRFFQESHMLLRLQISTDREGRIWSTYPLQQGHHWGTLFRGGAARRGPIIAAYLSALVGLIESASQGEQPHQMTQWAPYAGLCALSRDWAEQRGSARVQFRIERAPFQPISWEDRPVYTVVFTSPSLQVRETAP